MGSDGAVRPDTTDTHHAPPVDWELVPFDVACPRCAADLHGHSGTTCPACELPLDWADLVPLEHLRCLHCGYRVLGLRVPRCPECGRGVDWEAVLDAYHRAKTPLFEYQWRRHPVRSFVSTAFRSPWPSRFWRRVELSTPPRVGPLWLLAGVSIVLYVVLTPTLYALAASFEGLLLYYGPAMPPWIQWFSELWTGFIWQWRIPPVVWICVFWCVASLGALFVFPLSMHLRRVRPAQVLRVWVHAVAVKLALVPPCVAILPFAHRIPFGGLLEPLLMVAVLLHVVWSLRQAYRHYLRIPHAAFVAASSQVIAILATLIGAALATPYLDAAILDSLAWWQL